MTEILAIARAHRSLRLKRVRNLDQTLTFEIEGTRAGQQFVQHDAEAVDVGRRRGCLAG